MRILLSREIEEAMLVGVNVDPQHWSIYEVIEILKDGKFDAVRTVLFPHDVHRQLFMKECRANNIAVCGVIARESFPEFFNGYRESLKSLLRFYVPYVDYLQIGNEPDSEGPSSWTMKQGSLTALAKAVAIANHGRCRLIGPGLASGQPSFMMQNGDEAKRPRLWVNIATAISIHPYGQAIPPKEHPAGWQHGQMPELIDSYFATLADYPHSLWITEFGANEGNEHDLARYYSDCLTTFLDYTLEAAFAFCLSDRMVAGYGLLDVDNRPKERWSAVVDAIPIP